MTIASRLGWFPCLTRNFRHQRPLVKLGALVVLFLLDATPSAFAQRAGKNLHPDKQLIKQLLQRIETLESRLQQLERNEAHSAPSKLALPRVAERSASESPATPSEAAVHEEHNGMLFETMPTLQMRGFADVQYHIGDKRGDK